MEVCRYVDADGNTVDLSSSESWEVTATRVHAVTEYSPATGGDVTTIYHTYTVAPGGA